MSGALLIRAEGGPDIGYGHLARGVALACAWRRAGGEVVLMAPLSALEAFPELVAHGVRLHPTFRPLGDEPSIADTVAAARGAVAVVLDGPHLPLALQQQLRPTGARVAIFDDGEPGRPIDCDLLVNPNADASTLPYHGAQVRELRLLGPAFLPLREPPAQPALRADVGLTFGASDPEDWTAAAIRALDRVAPLAVAAVLGPAYRGTARLLRAAACFERPAAPARVLREVRVAVASVGVTLLELLREGVPTIAIARTGAQEREAEALQRAGAIAGVLCPAAFHDGMLPTLVHRLLADERRRQALATAAREVIDGAGAARVAEALRAPAMVAAA